MLNNCGEAWQREHSEITFSNFHHWLPALFSVCVCARGRIRGCIFNAVSHSGLKSHGQDAHVLPE